MLESFPNNRLIGCLQGEDTSICISKWKSKIDESFMEAEKCLIPASEKVNAKDAYFISLIYSGLGNVFAANDEGTKSVDTVESTKVSQDFNGFKQDLPGIAMT
ncbi:MAG: hypothetical protein R2769_09210 [Saprospiraceae bacterium]